MELSNNTILITGGTSGFGLEFATRFIELGNTVIVTGRNLEKLEALKQKIPAIQVIQSDVSSAEDIERLYNQVTEEFPDLNMLINNAGEMRKLILRHPYALPDITREIEINLMGPIRMIQQFLPHLKKKKTAAIVNVTSGIALMAYPIAPVYSASKSGLRSFTQALRVQLKNTSIKVFELVAPGSRTPLNEKFGNVDGAPANSNMRVSAEQIVDEALQGMKKDKLEIYPGMLKVFRYIMRHAPNFMLSQASKMGAKEMYGE